MRCGYVSRDAGENVYGVVFTADGVIDRGATAVRRADMRKQGLPVDQPISETLVPPPLSHDHGHPEPMEKLTDEERVAMAMSCRCCS
jgi:N-methylhydantoinase B